ncbi:MgtC/SapB family protein [Halanaerobium kushneri]|jgi:putative Mg2+ transporter-C (MgtC) family protein|uniref:Putative Mg2+ transporter-C (MgtC) family protein n=1 Tax=Halanaerobium kushneri TaxID=56779 RepID=A0A1N6ZW62_9FIRM|nr:MgtC/SapB family protein [Halanaerobium kushneri]SIR31047.1 putative Mg2+ transporter-C (MgtC) family protein [Halanaerobium kushneri]
MLDTILKIILSLIMAGLIGWDREKQGRPAGFRTHILVGIGSTTIMIVSILLYQSFPAADADPGRIAAQVVSGVGFLGAGTILVRGSNVRGLTTAASLWATAAIGLAIGGGFYFQGIITTLVVFIALYFLSDIKQSDNKRTDQQLICRTNDKHLEVYNVLYESMEKNNFKIKSIKTYRDSESSDFIIDCQFSTRQKEIKKINSMLMNLEVIEEVTLTFNKK